MRQQQPGPLGVDAQAALVVFAEVGGYVQKVGEIRWQIGEVRVTEVDAAGGDAQCLDLLARSGIGEPGDSPYLVVAGERLRDAVRDTTRRAGDENPFPAQHRLAVP
ncbi:hypothetical protein MPUL_43560 [Mycolicibacterium pulveris]|uniref:Uncharacterized protein n=1 Tax=Mycolicibacterium pulveris TaxID=36813 RepID=A0A7I7UP82_MYCPV|nr:hypothetical protein MPUL_43560 [Mycolicibacterium pulveris]